jgi:hypothetical protein
VAEQRRGVEALGVVDAALPVGDGDDDAAGVVQELRGQAADLAEPLHRDGRAAVVDACLVQR